MNKIESFRKRIYGHLRDCPQMFDASGVPIPVTVYFFSKANQGTISGKELEIEYGKYHLRTNAFIFDKKHDYYFGHSNILATMNLYVHPTSSQKKKCVEKMIRHI